VQNAVADCFADLWVALRAAGTPVPSNDIWIAAIAAREGATVITYDQRFDLIARVGVQILGS
jgi:tRNA(fMet)-specific endonuclease VapC